MPVGHPRLYDRHGWEPLHGGSAHGAGPEVHAAQGREPGVPRRQTLAARLVDLAAPWTGPYGGVPPWDQLQPDRFEAAFATAIAEQEREVDAIASSPLPPTFSNTIEALEASGRALDRVGRLFSVARENITNPEYQA